MISPRFIFLSVLLYACNQTQVPLSFEEKPERVTVVLPEKEWQASELFYNNKESLWLTKIDSSKVSGKVVEQFPNGRIARQFYVVDGKKEGYQKTYYPDGRMRFLESYEHNRLNGEVKRWNQSNGYKLVAHLNYQNGKLHGEQKKWYDTGELHKVLNLVNGKEEGMQRAYRKNGALYANYQALNGRTFGMKRSNLCLELDNEKVVYKQ